MSSMCDIGRPTGSRSSNPWVATITLCVVVTVPGFVSSAVAAITMQKTVEGGAVIIPVQTEANPSIQNDQGAKDDNASPGAGALPDALQKPTGKPYEKAFEGGFPKTPKRRAEVLSNLYAYLATAPDAETANEIASVIERLWLMSGSDTVSVLMERSMQAVAAKRPELAMSLLDAVVDLAPDYAEGWNRRAFVLFLQDQRERAAGDLRRVLALDPNHFKAMQGLAQILKDAGQSKGALKAFRKVLEVHPYADGAQDAVRELEVETEGQGI
ncbi:MAG: tetratricopeptide repeat protein [Pseudomonadota bacterium]